MTVRTKTVTEADLAADARATAALLSMAALPPGDPRRPALRNQAIVAWMPMAHRLARRFLPSPDAEDLHQTAMVGLIKAVDGFRPGRGDDFVAYALPTIVGELKRHLRDRCWAVRVPRRLHDRALTVTQAAGRLSQTLGRTPGAAEVAAELGLTVEEVLEGLEAGHARRATPLSATAGTHSALPLADTLPDDDHDYEDVEARLDLTRALRELSARERRITALYFYGGCTQAEIAEQVGVSQMHVSRMLTRAVAKLRCRFGVPPARTRLPRTRRAPAGAALSPHRPG